MNATGGRSAAEREGGSEDFWFRRIDPSGSVAGLSSWLGCGGRDRRPVIPGGGNVLPFFDEVTAES
jgi:hypothetical protein